MTLRLTLPPAIAVLSEINGGDPNRAVNAAQLTATLADGKQVPSALMKLVQLRSVDAGTTEQVRPQTSSMNSNGVNEKGTS